MRSKIALSGFAAAVLFAASAFAADPTVSFEIVLGDGVNPLAAQTWMRSLSEVGLSDIKVREARLGDEGKITNRGTDTSPRYHVVGILSTGDKLRLPGGSFRKTDVAAIRAYVNKIKDNGAAGLSATPESFGLSSEQLLELHKSLATPVSLETRGKRAGDVMRTLVAGLSVKVVVDESALAGFAGDDKVGDELQGVSVGTAMAAIIRPLGLVLVPHKPRGDDVQLIIYDVRKVEHSWPVGYPPDVPPLKVLPKLFEFLNAEIDDFVLTDALEALSGRIEAPFLLDHNSLARHEIEPGQIRVTFAKEKTYYKKVIDRILGQSSLKSEIRIDEANKPFIWVTTIRK